MAFTSCVLPLPPIASTPMKPCSPASDCPVSNALFAAPRTWTCMSVRSITVRPTASGRMSFFACSPITSSGICAESSLPSCLMTNIPASVKGSAVTAAQRSLSAITKAHRKRTPDDFPVQIPLPFALLDANHHALRVDIPRFQMDGFGNAQAGGVTGRQDRAVFNMGDALQELENFFGAENHGQFAGHFRHGNDLLQCPMLVQCFVVDETERRHRNADRTGRQFLFRCQIHLVGPNLLRTERFW